MKLPRQCAALIGGLGSRLGSLTANMPKPLLDCGGQPFLFWVLRELSRFGIEEIILLAGFRSERVEEFCRAAEASLPKPLKLTLSVEPEPAGTGGAIWHARGHLDESFLLINGDSWIDTNLARFLAGAAEIPDAVGYMLLRAMEDCSRYGVVEVAGSRAVSFREKPAVKQPGLINGGIFILDRAVLDYLTPNCSLEKDVLPVLAAKRLLHATAMEGYFIDIGIPADYERAQRELPKRLRRPAVFFDRDGVLNEDSGWVGSPERFRWTDGAMDAVRQVNDLGCHAFVVTNQAGVAKGFYGEHDVAHLHGWMTDGLRAFGATIDDIRYCPFHPEATVERYRRHSDWRKPGPGMILDLLHKWNVDADRSLLIGDKESDLEAARAAGVRGVLFPGGNLNDFVESVRQTDCSDKGAG
jgi:D,D-heptose 1,7-bisphosphate phosphatase